MTYWPWLLIGNTLIRYLVPGFNRLPRKVLLLQLADESIRSVRGWLLLLFLPAPSALSDSMGQKNVTQNVVWIHMKGQTDFSGHPVKNNCSHWPREQKSATKLRCHAGGIVSLPAIPMLVSLCGPWQLEALSCSSFFRVHELPGLLLVRKPHFHSFVWFPKFCGLQLPGDFVTLGILGRYQQIIVWLLKWLKRLFLNI